MRLALGAQPSTLISGVLRQGARWTLTGIAFGTALALAPARLLESFLFEVSPSDTVSIVVAAATLIAVALAAAYAPARRVVTIDPETTLRS